MPTIVAVLNEYSDVRVDDLLAVNVRGVIISYPEGPLERAFPYVVGVLAAVLLVV